MLEEAGELGGVAGDEFACGDGVVEELARFAADGFELREGDSVEFGIGQVDLEVGEAVGHRLGRGGEAGAIDKAFNQGFERRFESGAGGGELRGHAGRRGFHSGEKQSALGAEALDERGGDDAGFFGDVGEPDFRRTQALHDAGGGGEDFSVGSFAGAWGHFFGAAFEAAE